MEYKLDKKYNIIDILYANQIDKIISEIPNMTWREVYEAVILAMPILHKYGIQAMSSAIILQNMQLGIKEPDDRIAYAKDCFKK